MLNNPVNVTTNKIPPMEILKYANLFASIEGIKPLTLGAPDFPAPDFVKQATIEAINNNFTGYGPGKGTPGLRTEICQFLERKYQLHYDINNIIVTTGLTEAIGSLLLALLNEGDGVIIPSPFFTPYETATILNHGRPIYVDTSKTGLLLTPENLKQAVFENPHAKILILNYPNNPTGVTYTREQVKAMAQAIKETGLLVISDEIYSELVYGEKHTSLAEFIPEQTILLNGASKMYSMTGWRVGFIACPSDYLNAVMIAHEMTNSVSCLYNQIGATVAFKEGDQAIEMMRQEYAKRRDFVVRSLRDMGFVVTEPKGAFYVFPELPAFVNMDDREFAIDLANKGKVAVIPGACFGESGKNHIRISYAFSMEDLQISMERISKYLDTLK